MLTVVTPTVARVSLRGTLASIAPQLEPGDEHIVIGDGPQPAAAAMCAEFGARYLHGPVSRSYGTVQRDHGIANATGEYIAFCDDDDVFTPDALATVRAAIAEHPGVPLLFRMDTLHSGVLWADRVVREGNVGTPMIVTPRYADIPKWHDDGDPYTGDHRFIRRVTDAHSVEWREDVICIVGQRNL